MGRWAQRRVRGGGPPTSSGAGLITIVSAIATDSDTLVMTFSGNVTDTDFNVSLMADTTTSDIPSVVFNSAANALTWTNWSGAISPGDSWAYTGLVVGVSVPATGVMS